jgi:hypothetical protein
MRKFLILLLMIVAAPFAMADAVYTYTGPVYTSGSTGTGCVPAMPCADYTGKRITGTITTKLPAQPSSTTAVLPSDIVSFSFSDGVFTYASGDPDVRWNSFSLKTDAQGQVTGGSGLPIKWLSGTSPHVAGDIYRSMSFDSAGPTNVLNNVRTVSVSPDDTPNGFSPLSESSNAWVSAGPTGSWTSSLPAPSVVAITPGTGSTAGGTVVTLSGTNFLNGATVMVGVVPATLVTWISATELQVTVPAGSLGAQDVEVTNPDDQSGFLAGGFTYVAAPVAAPTSVPTLSEWGVILLSLLMAAVGLVASRRREV